MKETPPRRFPLPWTIGGNHCCYWVEDAEGKRLAYSYFSDGTESIGTASSIKLEKAEALRIARDIAKLPELIKR